VASAAAERARRRRHRWFVELVRPSPAMRIVDVRPQPDYPGPFVQADAADRLPFEDGAFDFAYSNSVIEHIAPAERARFASEIRRVARGWWVQTPAYGFPVEPHALLPFAHWLPVSLRRRYWRLGVAGEWEEIELMRRRELLELFGPEVLPEKIGPLTKSWVAVRRG
jgi:SAM-dependent methyltransferase